MWDSARGKTLQTRAHRELVSETGDNQQPPSIFWPCQAGRWEGSVGALGLLPALPVPETMLFGVPFAIMNADQS